MKIPFYNFPADKKKLLSKVTANEETLNEVVASVKEIIAQVKQNGDKALLSYCKKFDNVTLKNGFAINVKKEAENFSNNAEITKDFRSAVNRAITNVKNFHKKTKLENYNYTGKYGEKLALQIAPMETAGIYIPGGIGGTTPLISSLIMNYIPATIAGVKNIICISPPQQNGKLNVKLMYTLNKLGAKNVFVAGGAQAIAALAFGTKTIPSVDIITGPGNAYVNEAKRMLLGKVMVDGLYGNSEIIVISDGSQPAKHIAADMLSQCEHAGGELALLITNSKKHALEVEKEINAYIKVAPRKKEITSSLQSRGAIALVNNFNDAALLSNLVAPEHLELLTKNAKTLLPKIKHAGAIFVGGYASEPIGDYIAGTNHVLPTSGAARFSSPLGVYTFQRRQNVINYNKQAFNAYAPHAIQLAKSEGLHAHENALRVRQQ